jgi:hypothetical protein
MLTPIYQKTRRSTPDDLNPYTANMLEYGELLIMSANGRWDLIRRLKG